MKKLNMLRVIGLLSISACLCFSQESESIVGLIIETDDIQSELDGCGCHFPVFISTGSGETAWMRISEETIKFAIVKETASKDARIIFREYKAADILIKVELEYIPPESPPDSTGESSDFERQKATITVIKGRHQETVTVRGYCSC